MSSSRIHHKRFEIVLIKPSHYDDDGYVIQWMRSLIPSNTLGVLFGLVADAGARNVLGPEIDIHITSIDETNTRINPACLIQKIRSATAGGFVGIVGVQSNQFPRAVDIARPLRQAGIQVMIGGFHASGCLAMLPGMPSELQEAMDIGVSLFVGEAEGRIDEIIIDAAGKRLKPMYNYIKDLPSIENGPVPFVPKAVFRRTYGGLSSFDAGRGCPFQCSFCTIINVQGRKSRTRSPDDIERAIRMGLAEGTDEFFITDDDFARNSNWESILDRLIRIRNEPGNDNINYTIQVDTQCHRIPNFIEKLGRAHVINVFIGLENINPANLLAAKKRQNKIADYRDLLLACKRNGLLTWAGYIIGFPGDTPESVIRDIEVIKRELPIDILEFFVLTPLPGSEDHQKLHAANVAMDADLNKYDLNHVVTDHPKMSKSDWEDAYRLAWETYYTPQHCETVMRRAGKIGAISDWLIMLLAYFPHCWKFEGVHPLEGGVLRRKYRRDRRAGLPVEPALAFYVRYFGSLLRTNVRLVWTILRYRRLRRHIMNGPSVNSYIDEAITLVSEKQENLELPSGIPVARSAISQ